MLRILPLCLLWAHSSAEVICNPQVPPSLLPSVASCAYAMRRLEHTDQQIGPGNTIFSRVATGPHGIFLPATFLGIGPDYMPMTPVWCIIMLLWQPRPAVHLPSEEFDVFPFGKILQAANNIRDRCLTRRRGHAPQIGREWVQPHQWVDVQFGGIWGPTYKGLLTGNASNILSWDVVVQLSDGANVTIPSSVLRESTLPGISTA